MFYLYDGSFDGFLCCVYAHYYQESADGIRIQLSLIHIWIAPFVCLMISRKIQNVKMECAGTDIVKKILLWGDN